MNQNWGLTHADISPFVPRKESRAARLKIHQESDEDYNAAHSSSEESKRHASDDDFYLSPNEAKASKVGQLVGGKI
jgi:ATP-dependent protease ClpP protease subunit